jgi:hypothetical protein
VWTNLRVAGAPRLILTMVAVSLDDELAHIREVIPGAEITIVRLRASEEDLLERVRGREVGSGYDYQAPRTVEQARRMGREDGRGHIILDTGEKSVPEIAREALDRAGWPAQGEERLNADSRQRPEGATC